MDIKRQIKDILKELYFYSYQFTHPVEYKKVFFESIGGKYNDNPKAICETLHRLDPSIRLVWSIDKEKSNIDTIPEYIEIVDNKNRRDYYHALSTSSVFITSITMPHFKKREGQLYIQTWHGDRAFKKVLYDSEFRPDGFSLVEAVPGYCDLAIAGSDYGEMVYKSAFHYNGEILKIGTPRNDYLMSNSENRVNEIKDRLNLPANCHLLLYAPTLRRENQKQKTKQSIQNIDLSSTLELLSIKTGKDWKCLLRAHPAIVDLKGVKNFNNNIINVSKYEDMADLLAISDFLITDYSSCAGDFALTGRPIVLFQDDKEEYLKKDRGFYFNIENSPYMVATSQKELETIILSMSDESAKDNCKEILSFYNTVESGNSSVVIAERILDHIYKR